MARSTDPLPMPPDLASLRLIVHGAVGDQPKPKMSLGSASDTASLQGLASPVRHHRRSPSAHREIKETLDARVEFTSDEADGRTYHRINQYVIIDEIGRGSYGAVHRAMDQFGNEFAVKEFSKTRLRKRAQSNILRQGPHALPRHAPPRSDRGDGPMSPQLRHLRAGERSDALYLIREEIAIMKKLNHPNLVQLIEVLDDPEEDSLYMVLEMCHKGIVMHVGLDGLAEPYGDEACRHWFRDLILGIEYLHAQGVIHRDIKPDNLLLSEDDILKVVDFGISEMFEKADDMMTAKPAGSPAFLPPELCGKHQEVSGKAADIWAMGVSLFCLRYGKLPFNKPGILDMYDAIKTEDVPIPHDEDIIFADFLRRILDKDPDRRIIMAELREHSWVTKAGTDPLLSAEESCAHVVEPPNELELNRAFTRKMNHLLCVVKAMRKFKALLTKIRSEARDHGGESSVPGAAAVADGAWEKVYREEIEALVRQRRILLEHVDDDARIEVEHKGDQEPPLLGIGTGAMDGFAVDQATPDVVADSPTAVDFNVYDRAYEEAVEQQLRTSRSGKPTLYLTKFVKEVEHLGRLGSEIVESRGASPWTPRAGLDETRRQLHRRLASPSGGMLAQLVSRIGISDAARGSETRQPGGGEVRLRFDDRLLTTREGRPCHPRDDSAKPSRPTG